MYICSNQLSTMDLRPKKNLRFRRFFFDLWNQNRFIGGVKWDEMGTFSISDHLHPIHAR